MSKAEAGREKIEFGNRFVSTSALSGGRRGGGGEALPGEAAGREPLHRPRVFTPAHPPSRQHPERGSPGRSALGRRRRPPLPNPAAPCSISRRAGGRGAEREARAGEQSKAHLRPRQRIGSVSRRVPWDTVCGPRVCAGAWQQAPMDTRSGTARRAWGRNLFWPLGRAVISCSLLDPSRFAEKKPLLNKPIKPRDFFPITLPTLTRGRGSASTT